MKDEAVSQCIRPWRLTPAPQVRMVCLPHAGGSASYFRPWLNALPAEIDLLAISVVLPCDDREVNRLEAEGWQMATMQPLQVMTVEGGHFYLAQQYPLLDKATLTLDDLLQYPVFRWQVEPCPLLDQQMAVNASKYPPNIQFVYSFELMALWVAAGYGVGITAQSRIVSAREWDICMRPFADAPYEVVTHLLPSSRETDPVYLRFARRAQRVAKIGIG